MGEKSACIVGKRTVPALFPTILTVETEGQFGPNSTILKVVPKGESADFVARAREVFCVRKDGDTRPPFWGPACGKKEMFGNGFDYFHQ